MSAASDFPSRCQCCGTPQEISQKQTLYACDYRLDASKGAAVSMVSPALFHIACSPVFRCPSAAPSETKAGHSRESIRGAARGSASPAALLGAISASSVRIGPFDVGETQAKSFRDPSQDLRANPYLLVRDGAHICRNARSSPRRLKKGAFVVSLNIQH